MKAAAKPKPKAQAVPDKRAVASSPSPPPKTDDGDRPSSSGESDDSLVGTEYICAVVLSVACPSVCPTTLPETHGWRSRGVAYASMQGPGFLRNP